MDEEEVSLGRGSLPTEWLLVPFGSFGKRLEGEEGPRVMRTWCMALVRRFE